MKKAIIFILISFLPLTSCVKDNSNPVSEAKIPSTPILAPRKDTSSNIATPAVLTWNKSCGKNNYSLQVSSSSSFSSFVFNVSNIIETTQQIPVLNYLSVYYWRVNASNIAEASAWSKGLN
ncbi:MAG: hypothetical protein KJ799_17105 [Bacteroidetes bacterium]|nr:hypothetical protein [Bacteroidota bacterium]